MLFIVCSIVHIINPCLFKHKWIEATCTEAKHCEICGKTEGTTLPHKIIEGNCTTPSVCKFCGLVIKEAAGHNWEVTDIIKPATCADEGLRSSTCKICGENITEAIPKSNEHNFGEWIIENTFEDQGIRFNQTTRTCQICGYKEKDQKLVYLDEEKGKIISQMNICVTNIESYPGDDWHYMNVSIANNSDKVITELNFRIEFYDVDDNCIFSTNDACVNAIYPNQSTTTNASGTFSGNYSRYKIYITNIKYK